MNDVKALRKAVIAGYLRTAQSRCRPGDWSRDWLGFTRADTMAAAVINELAKRLKIDTMLFNKLMVGCALGVNENWTFGGRLIHLLAKWPTAIQMAAMEVMTGYSDLVMCAGMEQMSRVQMGMLGDGSDSISINPNLIGTKEYEHLDMNTIMSMILTAQKLACQSGITREEMEIFAKLSHDRAVQGQKDGFFDGEIMPYEAEQSDGSTMVVETDQAVREGVNLEEMAKLKLAWPAEEFITAGVSSPLNAGAAGCVVTTPEKAEELGLEILAEIVSMASVGVDPTIMGVGPVPASNLALERAGMRPSDIDYWEINEAFCVVALNCIKELELDVDKVNVMGGGTAIGHPLGMTGIRLTGTLARILAAKDGEVGCANACIGGGQGIATIIKRV